LRLLVVIPDGVGRFRHGRRVGRAAYVTYEKTRKIETTVYRVARDASDYRGPRQVLVDAWIPEQHRAGFLPGDLNWVGDGIYRARAYVNENRTTLAPFLASGDPEWDVREVA